MLKATLEDSGVAREDSEIYEDSQSADVTQELPQQSSSRGTGQLAGCSFRLWLGGGPESRMRHIMSHPSRPLNAAGVRGPKPRHLGAFVGPALSYPGLVEVKSSEILNGRITEPRLIQTHCLHLDYARGMAGDVPGSKDEHRSSVAEHVLSFFLGVFVA